MENRISQPFILKLMHRVMILSGIFSIGLLTLLFNQEIYADIPQEEKSKITSHIAKLHIPFIANQGQIDKSVEYYAKTLGGTVFITKDGEIIYSLPRVKKEKSLKGQAIKESFVGASISNVKGEEKALTKVNYFKGKDPKKWKQNIPTYSYVNLGEIYKGVELKLKAYGNNIEKLFYVNPGANPESIKVKIDGAKSLKVNEKGELELETALGALKFTKPCAYQEDRSEIKYVEVGYAVKDNEYRFRIGDYDKTKELIIDPLLASTFLGGSDGKDIASMSIDSSGNIFVAGRTFSADFPVTTGAYDTTDSFGDYCSFYSSDIFIAKFDKNLQNLIASTFLGLCTFNYISISIDNNGNVYVAGETSSSDFPTTPGAYDTIYSSGFSDIFISKLDNNLQNLLGSTLLGGSSQNSVRAIDIDNNGNVYVTGKTSSSDFPTTPGAYDTLYNGAETFISKLDSNLQNLLASTYLGGSVNISTACAIKIDSNGNVYVAGETSSSDFPTTPGAYDETKPGTLGNAEGFISKLDSNLQNLLASTYLGGGIALDEINSISIDNIGDVYVAGYTCSIDFPVTPGAYDTSINGDHEGNVFISKLDINLQNLLASTFLGTSEIPRPSIAMTASGNIYVAGGAGSSEFPTTPGSYDNSYNGFDGFISKIDSNLENLLSSTFLGGSNGGYVYSISINSSGDVYVTGLTMSPDFPTTPGAYDTSYNGGYCDVFISKLDSNLSSGPVTPPPSTHFGTQTNSGHAAEPVNTALGSYTYQHTDLRIPGRGVSFRFTRAYNSQDVYNGPLGHGWTHSYNIILTEDSGDDSVKIKWGDGHEDFYISNGDGTYTPQYGGVYDVLVKNADDTFTLTRKDQTRYDFDTTGKLTGITDKNSNSIVLTYDGLDNLITVSDTVGRDIDLAYDTSDRLIQVNDPIDRIIGYEYDANGDLIKVTDANGAITAFEYDGEHRLTKIILPKENILVDNTYDDQGRVISQTNGRGFISTFGYNTPSDGDTTITNPLGSTTIHTHDSAYRLTKMTDANGGTIHYAYDSNNNRTGITDKNGNVTYYTYDAIGNVTSKTDALGNVTTITYDGNNNPTQRTDALGNITTYGYDADGNLITTTDPLGNERSITYNIYGQPLTLTDANGHVTTSEYDAQGNLIKITDALGNITTFTFDGVGRRTNITNANGYTTSFAYDNNDSILAVTDPLGGTTAYAYDINENRTSVTDPNGNTTVYSYDENDLLTTITDPVGNVTTHTYDNVDNKTSTQDVGENTTQYSYDGIGNLIETKDALNNTTAYTYDGNGNLLSRTNALGNTTAFAYDALNRLIQTTDPLANTTQNNYDALGRLTHVTDAGGRVTQYSYDDLGRLIQVTDALSGVTTYSYDNIGNRTSITDAQGNTNSFVYDALNRLITKTDPLWNAQSYIYDSAGNRTSLTDANGNTIQYSYDGNSRLTDITYPDATAVAFSYDANGNRIGMTDQYGTYTYQFDDLDRMTSYTDGYGKTVNYSYDEAGNKTSLTYPDNKAVNYTYDPLNRMSTVTDWLGGTTIYTYDAAGNITNINNPNGTAAGNTYDNRNRLISIDNTKSDTSLISSYKFTLDSVGNHTQVIRNESLLPVLTNANKSYSYDNDNRLLASNGTAYNYDANGNMISKGSDTYTYDYEDRLSQTSIDGINTSYQYDGVGNRIAKVVDGVTTRYILDISGVLSQVLAETDESGTITNYYVYGLGLISKITPSNAASYYHYDSRGSTIALTDSTETITDKYAYDPFGKLANNEGFTANSFKYVGRFGVMDEGNGLKYIRARYYDSEIGRFITKDPLTGNDSDSQSLNRYVYALNNPVMLIDISGLSAKEGNIEANLYWPSDIDNSYLMELDEIEKDWNYGIANVISGIASHATEFKIVHVSGYWRNGKWVKPYWRRAPHVGKAGNLAKGLEKGLQYKVLFDLVKGGVEEYQKRGYTGKDLKEGILNIGDNIKFAIENPDALLTATTEGVTSSTAVVLNVLTYDLFDITGQKIENVIGKAMDKPTDWLGDKFYQWGWGW